MNSKTKDERAVEAINSADEASLRACMLALSTESEELRDKIDSYLSSIAYRYTAESYTDSSGVKRKAEAPVSICRRCGYAFDPDNNRKSCRYHPGE